MVNNSGGGTSAASGDAQSTALIGTMLDTMISRLNSPPTSQQSEASVLSSGPLKNPCGGDDLRLDVSFEANWR